MSIYLEILAGKIKNLPCLDALPCISVRGLTFSHDKDHKVREEVIGSNNLSKRGI